MGNACCTCALVTDILDEKNPNASKTSMLESPRHQTTHQATTNTPQLSRSASPGTQLIRANFGGDPVDTDFPADDDDDGTFSHHSDHWVHPKDLYAPEACSPRLTDFASLDSVVIDGHVTTKIIQPTPSTEAATGKPLRTDKSPLSSNCEIGFGSGGRARKYKQSTVRTKVSPRKFTRNEASSPRSLPRSGRRSFQRFPTSSNVSISSPNLSPASNRDPVTRRALPGASVAATKGATPVLRPLTRHAQAPTSSFSSLSLVHQPNHRGRPDLSILRPRSANPLPSLRSPSNARTGEGGPVGGEAGSQMQSFPVFKGSTSESQIGGLLDLGVSQREADTTLDLQDDTGTTYQTLFIVHGSRRLTGERIVPPSPPSSRHKSSPGDECRWRCASWLGTCQVRHVALQTSRPDEQLTGVSEFPAYSPTQAPRARAWWGAFECSPPSMVLRGPSVDMKDKGVQVDFNDHHFKLPYHVAHAKESCPCDTKPIEANCGTKLFGTDEMPEGNPNCLYQERLGSSCVSESTSPGPEEVLSGLSLVLSLDERGTDTVNEYLNVPYLIFNDDTEGTPRHEQALAPTLTQSYTSASPWRSASGDLRNAARTQGSRRTSDFNFSSSQVPGPFS